MNHICICKWLLLWDERYTKHSLTHTHPKQSECFLLNCTELSFISLAHSPSLLHSYTDGTHSIHHFFGTFIHSQYNHCFDLSFIFICRAIKYSLSLLFIRLTFQVQLVNFFLQFFFVFVYIIFIEQSHIKKDEFIYKISNENAGKSRPQPIECNW